MTTSPKPFDTIEWDGPAETWAAPFTPERVSRLRAAHAMADDQMVAIVAFGPDWADCVCALPCDLDHFGDGEEGDWQIRFGRMPLSAYSALPEHGGW